MDIPSLLRILNLSLKGSKITRKERNEGSILSFTLFHSTQMREIEQRVWMVHPFFARNQLDMKERKRKRDR